MFHVSLSWQQQVDRVGGWTENFWNNLDSQAAVYTKTIGLIHSLFNLKGNPAFCPRFRISEVGKFRSAKPYKTQQLPGNSVGPDTASDYPTTKLQVKFTGSTIQATTQWLGGLRDRDFSGGGFWLPQGASVNFWNSLVTTLTTIGNGWNIYVLDPSVVPFNITAIDPATGIVTTVGANILDQAKVRVKGVRGLTTANGIWRVTKVADQQYRLQGWVSTTQPMTKSNASIRAQIYAGQPISKVEAIQSTSHKVGKPTGLLGGRRKRRAS